MTVKRVRRSILESRRSISYESKRSDVLTSEGKYVDEGICGETYEACHWTFSVETEELIVEGNGQMNDSIEYQTS